VCSCLSFCIHTLVLENGDKLSKSRTLDLKICFLDRWKLDVNNLLVKDMDKASLLSPLPFFPSLPFSFHLISLFFLSSHLEAG